MRRCYIQSLSSMSAVLAVAQQELNCLIEFRIFAYIFLYSILRM
jgi:hypothetical protein